MGPPATMDSGEAFTRREPEKGKHTSLIPVPVMALRKVSHGVLVATHLVHRSHQAITCHPVGGSKSGGWGKGRKLEEGGEEGQEA